MDWGKVGDFLTNNAGKEVALVGELLTGNVPGAIATGVALVSGATGTTDPVKSLAALQSDPATMIRLQELANQEQASIRDHIKDMTALKLADQQAEQDTTAKVTISGDNAEDPFVRRTRPGQSWCSLIAAFVFVFTHKIENQIDVYVLGLLLTLPWAYAGLRQIGKGIDSFQNGKIAVAQSSQN